MADHATRAAVATNGVQDPNARSIRTGQRHHGSGRGGSNSARRRGPRPAAAVSTDAITGDGPITPSTRGSDRGGERGSGNRRRFRRGGSEQRGRDNTTNATTSDGPARGGRRGVGGHAFGGHLTSARQTIDNGLHGDAPEFTPGQPMQRRDTATTDASSLSPISRKDSSLRSTAPDIPTRTHQDIANGLYECSICTNEIRANSKVWSCTLCWTVFHLGCIKKWSKNEGSTMVPVGPVDEDDPAPRQWRCPGCNLAKDALPAAYECWCAKELDPKPISGVPPHSCGQTCAKPRTIPKKCPHPCELTCHAGPCPPCAHMGPVQSCFCGKEVSSRRCIETNYVDGWSCGQVCGDMMACGEHPCPQLCHEGLCGTCLVTVEAKCYCGKSEKQLPCFERQEPKRSVTLSEHESEFLIKWEGVFDCGNLCERHFDCGKHICERLCHPQDLNAAHCPRSPDVVSHCPCSKTALSEISSTERTTCEDPIPNCTQTCSKKLSCGHLCETACHPGTCPPCEHSVDISCRCGRVTNQKKCHERTNEFPVCTRTCKATLNCGRHECGELCCPAEKRAQERVAQKKKSRVLGAAPRAFDQNVEPEHICTRLCGRPLKCGHHSCPELCHKGPCRACREAIFEEIQCHCGKTVLYPPLPCGTGSPPCRFQCERPKVCGHPTVPHNCHGDQEPCPTCPYLMEKVCLCKRKTLKNQPCFRTEVLCGEVCGKRLRCGSHFCRKLCHRPGECEDVGSRCQQQCGDPKKACGHPCEERCHNPSSCKEEKSCQSKIIITCDCQAIKTEIKCLASRTSEGNKNKKLKCDEECLRLERNRQLALALNVDPARQDNHIPYSNQTMELYQEDVPWSQAQERELRLFAADDTEKRLRCKPMARHRRSFMHSLAEDFGLDSESLDPEPYRHVFIFKTPRFVKAPMKMLADCMRIRNVSGQVSGSGIPMTSRPEQPSLATDNEPFNGYVLTAPRFALTIEELRAETALAMAQSNMLTFDIEFLPSEEVVYRARPSNSNTTIAPAALESHLRSLKPAFIAAIGGKKLAGSVSMCALDSSANILRRETTETSVSSGWNRVAARATSSKGPPMAPTTAVIGQKSSFTVLSKRKPNNTQKLASTDEVADDWELEMEKEEQSNLKSRHEQINNLHGTSESTADSSMITKTHENFDTIHSEESQDSGMNSEQVANTESA